METHSKYLPKRKSTRLPDFDYSQEGAYFVTINTNKRQAIFGQNINGKVQLSPLGKIVLEELKKLERRFPNIRLDEFVIMPDHIHIIFFIRTHFSSSSKNEGFSRPVKGSIPTVVRSFKSSVTIRAGHLLQEEKVIWQRGFYEEVIDDDDKLEAIREYILMNPGR